MNNYFICKNADLCYSSKKKHIDTHGHLGHRTLTPTSSLPTGKYCLFAITTNGVFHYGEARRGIDELNHYDLTGHKDVYTAGEFIKGENGKFFISNMSGTYCPDSLDAILFAVDALRHAGEITSEADIDEIKFFTGEKSVSLEYEFCSQNKYQFARKYELYSTPVFDVLVDDSTVSASADTDYCLVM